MAAIVFEPGKEVADINSAQTRISVPSHLDQVPWLDFQKERACALTDALSLELEKMARKPTAKRVHDTRVALRRWFSIWSVLKEQDWESKNIRKRVLKKLRHLLKLLGRLRDWDVSLELGQALGCPQALLELWQCERKRHLREVRAEITRLSIPDLLMKLRNYLLKRYSKLRHAEHYLNEKTYTKLDIAVNEQERRVQLLESVAQSGSQLHELRLAIKHWRYLMVEFFGLTNLQLVKAQQILGNLHDYESLEELLADKQVPEILALVKVRKNELLSAFTEIRSSLPYGLRPILISTTYSSTLNNRSNC